MTIVQHKQILLDLQVIGLCWRGRFRSVESGLTWPKRQEIITNLDRWRDQKAVQLTCGRAPIEPTRCTCRSVEDIPRALEVHV